jgi:molecular chaperone GrpE
MNSQNTGPTPDAPNGEGSAGTAQAGSPDTLDSKLAALEAQLKEEKNRYLYLYAEFENYKKRAVKERSDTMKFGWEPVARDLLQILDNFERAIAHMPPGTDASFADGLRMIAQQFHATLAKQGVQAIETVGKPFDPHLHEAMGQEPSEHPSGSVSQEQLKGYTLHGRLLRPARVMISA